MSDKALQAELLHAAVARLPADELSAVRSAALARISASGFPTTRDENWKYTNLSGAAALSNEWLQKLPVAARNDDSAISPGISEKIDAHWLTIRNGVIDPASLTALAALVESGVRITKLTDGIGDNSISIEEPMSAFNAALLRDGLRIKVDNGAYLEKPVGILQVDDDVAAVTQIRVLIEVGPNAKLQIVEAAISSGSGPQFLNSVMQVSLADGAALDAVRIQQRAAGHLNVNRVSVQLARDAKLDYTNFDFGGSLARNDIVADIAGGGASVNLRGLYLAGTRQHIDNHTRVDHRVGPATSSEEYRGILGANSRCVFNGKAVVHSGADGTDASQSNHNLLLSEQAEIDTKPELEIYADDVKCSHGATVGQLDRSALFYLRSRGLGRTQAAEALTRAFAAVIPGQLPIADCHEFVMEAMDDKLNALVSENPQ